RDHWLMMNTPNAIPKPSVPGEPTAPDLSGLASPGEPAGRISVALVSGPGPQSTHEVQALLRKRLRLFGLIGTATFVFFGTLQTSALFQGRTSSLAHWLVTAEFWLVLVTLAGLTGILWARRPLSLTVLRGIEAASVGACLAHLALIVWLDLQFGSSLARALAASPVDGGPSVSYWGLPFFILIVGYGTLIPNTGRRCLLVVGIISLTPLTIPAVSALPV